MRKLHALAKTTLSATDSSDPLHDRARAAAEYSQAERTVPLIGSGRSVAHELLDELVDRDRSVSSLKVGTANTYLRFDADGICRGVYVVGSGAPNRAFDLADASAALFLATGEPNSVRLPTSDRSDVLWKAGQVPVLARWYERRLWELRIGDANP
jgi:hypothetical protein